MGCSNIFETYYIKDVDDIRIQSSSSDVRDFSRYGCYGLLLIKLFFFIDF